MRNVAAVLIAIALLTPAAHAANVEVSRPHIVFLSDAGAALACKGPERKGCTTLVNEFYCECLHNNETDKWTLNLRLVSTPYVYTTTPEIIRHEMEHIADIRTSLNEYAAGLMLRTFDNAQSCATFIVDEKATFTSTVRAMQRATTIRRDGVRYAQRQGAQ